MQVKLVIVNGKHAGKVVPIRKAKFLIGRAADCHLKPGGESVGRHHCAILVGKEVVVVRDFGSTTGTLVNDEKVRGQRRLQPGDRLTIGPWEFQVQCTGEGAAPKPRVKPTTRSVGGVSSSDDDFDVTEWLGEAQTSPPASKRKAAKDAASIAQGDSAESSAESEDAPPEDLTEEEKEERRLRGGIVGVSKSAQARRSSETSRNAAADALKRFFGGG